MLVSAYGGRLRSKVEALQDLLEQRHCFEGLVLPRVILPPLGRDDHLTGDLSGACLATGQYLAAACFQERAAGGQAQQRAAASAGALLRLQEITGQPGLLARAFKAAAGPTWDEALYPGPWHQMGVYRWLGAPDAPALVGRTFGLCLYHDLAADEPQRGRLAADLAAVAERAREHGMRLVDERGAVTTSLHDGAHVLLGLHLLKCADHLLGEERFQRHYLELATEQHLAQVAQAGPPPLVGLMALYHLLAYEQDPDLAAYYRIALEQYWQAPRREECPLVDLVYHAYQPQAEMSPALVDYFRAYQPPRHRLALQPEGGEAVEAATEDSPHLPLLCYWMARHYGFLTEEA